MPTSVAAMCHAAKTRFDRRFGSMCHDAVLEWLIAGGFVADKNYTPSAGDRSVVFAKMLVNTSDPQIKTQKELDDLAKGSVIGFWSDGKIQHSIISLGDRILAGANNGGVLRGGKKDPLPRIDPSNLRAIFLTKQLDLDESTGTVGGGGYTMHWQKPDVIGARVGSVVG